MRRLIIALLCTLVVAMPALAQSVTPIYLPLLEKPAATPAPTQVPPTAAPTSPPAPQPTATPAPLPPSYNNCQADPNPNAAPNYPVRIVQIHKGNETVTVQNVSSTAINLSGWRMCSITGNQQHPVSGMLQPGEQRQFPGPSGNIWNNGERDDGALYDPQGSLSSYLVCSKLICP